MLAKDFIRRTSSSEANVLARSYSALMFPEQLKEMIQSIYNDVDCSVYKKFHLHQLVNNILLHSYNGEEIIKYSIAKTYFRKRAVGAFEVKVKSSRLDFLTINGVTCSYEIKSALDSLHKLDKQARDYSTVFEYNSVILDEKHLKDAMAILPASYGILIFDGKKIQRKREPIKNQDIDPASQLALLTKRELVSGFRSCNGEVKQILDNVSAQEINETFKLILKRRYQKKWDFILLHRDEILPIDLQFFFSTMLAPALLYQTR